jgi:23S rRNA (cytidine1920-2'-O)/16S rRNA (cytidine1409-2'-O)-methyltransferase
LDEELVARGLVESRSRAQALIMAGDVLINGAAVTRAGAAVKAGDVLSLRAKPRFVSRGGEKLAHALDVFELDVRGKVVADFGASTGGFTDCLLQYGAARVYAIDVGHGQLAAQLRADERVVVMDRTNARYLESLPDLVDVVTIDVSFIGLELVLPAALAVLRPAGRILALVKPQFEAGREAVGRGGVVRDPEVHVRVLRRLFETATELGLGVLGLTASPLRGPAGNIEFLTLMAPNEPSIAVETAIDATMALVPAK